LGSKGSPRTLRSRMPPSAVMASRDPRVCASPCRATNNNLKGLRTLTRMSRPESGRDWLACATFVRKQRGVDHGDRLYRRNLVTSPRARNLSSLSLSKGSQPVGPTLGSRRRRPPRPPPTQTRPPDPESGITYIHSLRGTARAGDAHGTPTQSHISPSTLVHENWGLGVGVQGVGTHRFEEGCQVRPGLQVPAAAQSIELYSLHQGAQMIHNLCTQEKGGTGPPLWPKPQGSDHVVPTSTSELELNRSRTCAQCTQERGGPPATRSELCTPFRPSIDFP